MSDRFRHGRIDVAEILHGFIDREVLPGLGLEPGAFWSRLETFLVDLAPRNRALLDKRDALQAQIDGWHRERSGKIFDAAAYKAFLTEIGYLVPRGASFGVATAHVDPEISSQAGPQLVVPIMNARYALNAANARWGSLYDALYGTDALLPPDPAKRGFDPERGARVIAWGRDFLDRIAPLTKGSHKDLSHYYLEHGSLARALAEGGVAALDDPAWLAGYCGDPPHPRSILLVHNGLHVEILIDRDHPIGKDDRGRRLRCRARIGADDDPGLRGFGRCGRRRGQGRRLSQLARPDEGRSLRDLRQGRPAIRAPHGPRPRLQGAGRRQPQPAGPRACCWCAMSAI